MPAMMIGAILLGVAVDDILQLLAAWRTRGSLKRGLVNCWLACVGSSLVGAICMLAFLASPFIPTAQFGLLMALGLVFALLGDMCVLPALLHLASREARLAGLAHKSGQPEE
jgi:predicted RND superfamily exporter protein